MSLAENLQVVAVSKLDIPAPITLPRIIAITAEVFNTTYRDMTDPPRFAYLARARKAYAYVARTLTARSSPQIGKALGGRDHSTIMEAYRKAEILVETDPEFLAKVRTIMDRLTYAAARHVTADRIVISGREVDHLTCPHCRRLVIETQEIPE